LYFSITTDDKSVRESTAITMLIIPYCSKIWNRKYCTWHPSFCCRRYGNKIYVSNFLIYVNSIHSWMHIAYPRRGLSERLLQLLIIMTLEIEAILYSFSIFWFLSPLDSCWSFTPNDLWTNICIIHFEIAWYSIGNDLDAECH
jgi:hypothetical protein